MDGGSFTFHDLAPGEDSFRDSVLNGLMGEPKSLPCTFFYDSHGAELFERITTVPEYYLTRTELGILESRAGEIAAHIGPNARLIELGSGALRTLRRAPLPSSMRRAFGPTCAAISPARASRMPSSVRVR